MDGCYLYTASNRGTKDVLVVVLVVVLAYHVYIYTQTQTQTQRQTDTHTQRHRHMPTLGARVRVHLLHPVRQAVHRHVEARAEDVLVIGGEEPRALFPVAVEGGPPRAVAVRVLPCWFWGRRGGCICVYMDTSMYINTYIYIFMCRYVHEGCPPAHSSILPQP